jgi:ribonuclease G
MSNELLISSTETGNRIALLHDKKLVEYHIDSHTSELTVGDVYLGTVTQLDPKLNAAFVDIGQYRDAFLHYLDLGPRINSMNKYVQQLITQKNASYKLSSYKIEPDIDKLGKIDDVLKKGQKILVQIAKEPISTKGARLSCELSLAGRYLVLVPFAEKISISRKITSREERRRLLKLAESIKPKNFGLVIRTVAAEKSVEELEKDMRNLVEKWEEGSKNLKDAKVGTKIIGEISRTNSILRDILNDTFDSIVIDNESVYEEVKDYIKGISPDSAHIVRLYQGKIKLFEALGIEKQIKILFGRTVSLFSGGYLVIEHTEALTVVDVNSGSNRGKDEVENQEAAALRVNLEAVEEVARQLRLRDIGGIIVVDFIDQRRMENRKAIFDAMRKSMRTDRAKHSVLPLSKFGLLQITRQRVRPVLPINTSEVCPTCNGTGKVSPTIAIADTIEAHVKKLLTEQNEKGLEIALHPYLHAFFTKGLISKQMKWLFNYSTWVKLTIDSSLGISDYIFRNKLGQEIEL